MPHRNTTTELRSLSLLKSTSDPYIVLVVMSQVRSITMVLITAVVTIWQSFVTSNKMQDAVNYQAATEHRHLELCKRNLSPPADVLKSITDLLTCTDVVVGEN